MRELDCWLAHGNVVLPHFLWFKLKIAALDSVLPHQ
jgi:hypothetical protein